jgi:hypothetical protein
MKLALYVPQGYINKCENIFAISGCMFEMLILCRCQNDKESI